MSTGKIDRNAPAALRSTGPAVATAEVVEVVPVVAGVPQAEFGEQSKQFDTKAAEGKAVSTTASAAKLWGYASVGAGKVPLSVMTLKNLTPDQARAKLEECKKAREAIGERICCREDELDDRWKLMRLQKRTEALKTYLAQSETLPEAQRAELAAHVAKAEQLDEQIKTLLGEIEKWPPQPGSHRRGTKEQRRELASLIMQARRELNQAVDDGTHCVDKAGCRTERLTLTEELIDPSGGASSQYGSMSALVGEYFQLGFMISTLNNIYFGPMAELIKTLDRETAEARKRSAIEDDWRQADLLMQRLMEELALKRALRKAPGEAVKTRNFSKMTSTEADKALRAEGKR
ncbi:MAG: hypothetical protein IPJ65_11005 [Archangiaceae bacterium]|nr:hypothetical protein [Archangiaceae bacterium]